MRKNINKLIAFAIGISVMSGGAMPAFAAELQYYYTILLLQLQ